MQLPKIATKQVGSNGKRKVRSSVLIVILSALGIAVSALGAIPKQFQNSEIIFAVIFIVAVGLMWLNREKGGEQNGT